MIRQIKITPIGLALFYSLGSTLSCLLFALVEGVFCGSNNGEIVIAPLYTNYSTIIDFVLLNPLVLYCAHKCINQIEFSYKKQKAKDFLSTYHKVGVFVISFAVGITLMKFYFNSCLEDKYYDAFVQPNLENGQNSVTITGWIAFFWTSLFIGLTLFMFYQYFNYLRFLFSLRKLRSFDVFHEDNVSGQRYLMLPVINFSYAMLICLLIFIGFGIYDYLIIKLENSFRIYGLIIYILVASSGLYLPVIKLHKLMTLQRKKLVNPLVNKSKELLKELSNDKKSNLASGEITKIDALLDHMNKCKLLSDKIPVWPLPKIELSKVSLGIVAASFPLIKSIIETLIKSYS